MVDLNAMNQTMPDPYSFVQRYFPPIMIDEIQYTLRY